jgi:hypothetical protein
MTTRRRVSALALLLSLATVAGACSTERTDGEPVAATGERGWLGDDGGPADADEPAGRAGGAVEESMAYGEGDVASGKVAPSAAALAPEAPGGGDSLTVPPIERQGPGLRAGSVDDNKNFADYLKYRDEFRRLGITVSDIDVTIRHSVTAVDRDGNPLLGAVVRAGDQEARTFADGQALLFGDLPGEITVSYGDAEVTVPIGDGRQHRAQLPVTRPEGRAKLDVLFLIDATGSMGDEIDRLKESVTAVARRVDGLEANPDLRLGMTVYRDRGDAYVTRTFDFTSDVAAFNDALASVEAGGGGDTPEDMNAALHEALTAPAWRGDDTVKLVFLIADAPPHLDYQDGPDYADDLRTAARRGVKLQPIASSGLDDQGEYVFRQLAQMTMGRFTFLTYGADGASPGDSTDHHVSDYAVLSLDDLVVRLVSDELGGAAPGGQ